jgi:hypothetical protein
MRRSPRLQEKTLQEVKISEVEELTADFKALQLSAAATEISEVKKSASEESSPSSEWEMQPLYRETGKSGAQINIDGGTVLAADRGRTLIGPQGEHVSAYCLYQELAYMSCEGLSRKETIARIKENFGKLSIGESNLKKLEEVASSIDDAAVGLINREERKLLTRTLRGVNKLISVKAELIKIFADENITKLLSAEQALLIREGLERLSEVKEVNDVKNAIRESNRFKLSSLIVEMLDICIWGANKLEYVSFPREGLGENPNTGEEKKAKDGLRLLSNFLEKNEDVTEDKKSIAKLNKVWGISEDMLKAVSTSSSIDELLSYEKFKQISDYMGKLFYYPRVEPKDLIDPSSHEWSEIVKAKYNKDALPRDNDVEKLYQVAARHVVLIFNCFRGLSCFSEIRQRKIVDSFLNDLIEKEGWREEEVELDSFLDALDEYAILFYKEGNFSMKEHDESKIKFKQASISKSIS